METVEDWADRAMRRLVPLTPAALGATLVLLSLAHLATVPTLTAAYLTMASGTAGLALGVCAVLWRGHTLGWHTLHLILAGCLALGFADAAAYVWATASLERTADLVLLTAASGLVLIDRRWHYGVVAVQLGSWSVLAAAAGPTAPYHLASLAIAVVLTTGVRRARITSLDEVRTLQATAAMAVLDPLTGLPDRRGVQIVARHLLAIARRESGAVGCTFVGIDGFEEVLARTDEDTADALLVHVGEVMTAVVRATDVVGRWSPTHFVVVSHGIGAPMDVLEQRIVERVEQGCPVDETVWNRRLHLGRAMLHPWDDGGLVTTLEAAERDMYERAGLEPPAGSSAADAEAAQAHQRQVQAAAGQAVSELVAGASAQALVTVDDPGDGGR